MAHETSDLRPAQQHIALVRRELIGRRRELENALRTDVLLHARERCGMRALLVVVRATGSRQRHHPALVRHGDVSSQLRAHAHLFFARR